MGKSKNIGRAGTGVSYVGVRNGKKTWRARLYWIDGRTGKTCEKRVTFAADSKAQALLKREQELAKARGEATLVDERVRFERAADEWFATITQKATRHSWGCHARALKRQFGTWWLDTVTARHAQDYLDAIERSPGYVNSRIDVTAHIFDHAIRKGWATTNVAKDLKRRSTRLAGLNELGEAPRRALTADEALAYLADLQKHEPEVYPLVVTQLVLGCRFAEVSALRREDVDLDSGLVKIRRGQYMGTVGSTKGKYARKAALPLTARAMLRAHLERMEHEQWPGWRELVFPRPAFGRRKHSNHWSSTTVSNAVGRSFTRLGIDVKGKTHVARHTLITLTSDHAAERVLREMVGHVGSVHDRYKHAHEAEVISLGEVVGRKVLREKGGET